MIGREGGVLEFRGFSYVESYPHPHTPGVFLVFALGWYHVGIWLGDMGEWFKVKREGVDRGVMVISEVIAQLGLAMGEMGDVPVLVGMVPVAEDGGVKGETRGVEAGRLLKFHGDRRQVWLV